MHKRKTALRVLAWLPLAGWYWLIFRFSAQTADASGSLSDGLLFQLLTALSPAFAAAPGEAQAGGIELLSFFERKAAHMFLYFVMALLAFFALSLLARKLSTRSGLALVICALLASLDEYHQTMVPGRSGEVRDVLVDLSGAAIAMALTALPLLVGNRAAAVTAAALCVLPLLPALASPAAAAGFPPFVWSASGMEDYSTAQQAALLAALGPALRDVLFLAACGLLGAFVLWAGLFAKLPFFRALGVCAGAAAAAGLLAWLASVALPLAALGVAALGIVGAGALWGFSALCGQAAAWAK